ncbi:hypothetical protein CU254_41270 (plasmid) [Amycolatopsis sp. AA4]|uniref:hypothetical protein n=1 Tax=Actinomycetes TaxID=1760 RepID=UPI0001B55C1F|nr:MULTISPECIES: hypothetical protein [Actinomycetes]ATY17020.1 hypothetical protein CU254_41270 [Amycolatopsis sp. AA4]
MTSTGAREGAFPTAHSVCPGPPECLAHLHSDFADFDHYVDCNRIPEAHWGAAFSAWAALATGGPFPVGVRVQP